MDYAIETEQLTGGYGKSMVLREVSLRVPQSSIFGLLGPNGAGKTTLLRMLLGLLRPASGNVRLFGDELRTALPAVLRRTGSLIEQPSLYDHLTGAENLDAIRILRGLPQSDAKRASKTLGVGKYIHRRVKEYSRGMRQRLGLAIAILGNPDLLILDEPMTGLDAEGLEIFRTMVRSLHQEHRATILISSHQFGEVDQVATHIGIMSAAGDLLYQGPRNELSERVPQGLVLKVNRVADAIRILASANFQAESAHEHLLIRQATTEIACDVNRLLVENGIGVHHLAIESVTLESLFVKVTTTVKPWDAL